MKARCKSGNPREEAAEAAASTKAELQKLELELAAIQGETGLIQVCVDAQIVGEVLSAWTGIPAGKMLKDEIRQPILALQDPPWQAGNWSAARHGDHQPACADFACVA